MDILITRRLTLRPPLDVDADAITAALQNTNITRMLTSVPQPYTLEDAMNWIEARQRFQEQCCFTIYGQKLMGVVSIEVKDGQPNLGFWLDEPYWGKGYVTEAVRAVLSNSFRKGGHGSIASGYYEDNPASGRVLEKLGFEPDGKKPHFNLTRNCDVPCNRMKLTRENFESLFGSLDNTVAA